ncbi:MAG: PH domain-containing protein [Phycisphaeraceae bacterium]
MQKSQEKQAKQYQSRAALARGLTPRGSDTAFSEAGADNGVAEVDPRITALLPPQLLQGGELIILLLKPSPWFIILESLRTLTALMMLLVIAWVLAKYDLLPMGQRDVVLAGIAIGGLRLFWQFLEWLSRVYVLTDRRIIRVRGVLRVHVFECPLKQVQHTTAIYSVPERLVGLGTIGFATAGTAVTEAYWQMVAKPLQVHQTVVETLNRYR